MHNLSIRYLTLSQLIVTIQTFLLGFKNGGLFLPENNLFFSSDFLEIFTGKINARLRIKQETSIPKTYVWVEDFSCIKKITFFTIHNNNQFGIIDLFMLIYTFKLPVTYCPAAI